MISRVFPAHQIILCVQSPVFKRMLLSDYFKDKKVKKIVIHTVNPEVFGEFLKYFYTGQITLKPQNALHLLDLARKYELLELEECCKKYVDSEITSSSALHLWETAQSYDLAELQNNCWQYIILNTTDVLKQTEIPHGTLSPAIITQLAQSTELNCSEIELLDFVLKWVRKTERNFASEDVKNIMQYIRFSNLSPTRLAELVTQNIIEDRILLEAFAYQANPQLFEGHQRFKSRKAKQTLPEKFQDIEEKENKPEQEAENETLPGSDDEWQSIENLTTATN